MQLSIDETNHLLNYAEHSSLYPRNPWDTIIMYALQRHLSVIETNILLTDATGSFNTVIFLSTDELDLQSGPRAIT